MKIDIETYYQHFTVVLDTSNMQSFYRETSMAWEKARLQELRRGTDGIAQATTSAAPSDGILRTLSMNAVSGLLVLLTESPSTPCWSLKIYHNDVDNDIIHRSEDGRPVDQPSLLRITQ